MYWTFVDHISYMCERKCVNTPNTSKLLATSWAPFHIYMFADGSIQQRINKHSDHQQIRLFFNNVFYVVLFDTLRLSFVYNREFFFVFISHSMSRLQFTDNHACVMQNVFYWVQQKFTPISASKWISAPRAIWIELIAVNLFTCLVYLSKWNGSIA